jgi:hypothetical protein
VASSAAPDVDLEIAVTNPRNACADGSIIVAQEKTVGECQGYAGAANLDDLHGRGNKLGGRMSLDEHGNFEDGVPKGMCTCGRARDVRRRRHRRVTAPSRG